MAGKRSVLVGVLFVSFISAAAGEWLFFDNHRWYISVYGSGTGPERTWHAARQWCMENGGDLAKYTTSSVQTWLAVQIEYTGYTGNLWIGSSDLDRTGQFRWGDGSVLPFGMLWASGYPQRDDIGQLCGYTDKDGEWKNGHCGLDNAFICQRPNLDDPTPRTDPPTDTVPGYCPQGYTPSGNKCFKVVKPSNFEDGMNWMDALSACRAEGGKTPDLASIHSNAEAAAIMSQIQGYEYGVYIGRRRESYYDPWTWSDNSDNDYTNWGQYEPSGSIDHCGEIWQSRGQEGTWNNINCNSKRGYVCQTFKDDGSVIVTPPMTPPGSDCPAGYTAYWYGCYRLTPSSSTWASARATCQQEGGHLVSIHSESENAGVLNMVAGSLGVTSVWIGLNDRDVEGTYYWSDNWHVVYTKWGDNQPSKPLGGGCVAMDTYGYWTDTACSSSKRAICKITSASPQTTPPVVAGSCPVSENSDVKWHAYGSYCYGTIGGGYSAPYKNYDDAQEECRKLGGYQSNLVSIHDMLENSFLTIEVKAAVGTIKDSFWLGLRKSDKDSGFGWQDRSAVDYTNWALGEPNDSDGTALCTRMYTRGGNEGRWDDDSCSKELYYACKRPKDPPPTTPAYPEVQPGRCPTSEWLDFGASCLLFRPDEYATWGQAKQECVDVGGNLASVLSQDENWQLHNMLTDNQRIPFDRYYWLGLSKDDADSEFQWVDESKINFTNWARGEPNPSAGHFCVELHGGGFSTVRQWRATLCDQRRGFVCRATKASGGSEGNSSSSRSAGIAFGIIGGLILIAGVAVVVLRYRQDHATSGTTNGGTMTGAANNGFDNVTYDTSNHATTINNGGSSGNGGALVQGGVLYLDK